MDDAKFLTLCQLASTHSLTESDFRLLGAPTDLPGQFKRNLQRYELLFSPAIYQPAGSIPFQLHALLDTPAARYSLYESLGLLQGMYLYIDDLASSVDYPHLDLGLLVPKLPFFCPGAGEEGIARKLDAATPEKWSRACTDFRKFLQNPETGLKTDRESYRRLICTLKSAEIEASANRRLVRDAICQFSRVDSADDSRPQWMEERLFDHLIGAYRQAEQSFSLQTEFMSVLEGAPHLFVSDAAMSCMLWLLDCAGKRDCKDSAHMLGLVASDSGEPTKRGKRMWEWIRNAAHASDASLRPPRSLSASPIRDEWGTIRHEAPPVVREEEIEWLVHEIYRNSQLQPLGSFYYDTAEWARVREAVTALDSAHLGWSLRNLGSGTPPGTSGVRLSFHPGLQRLLRLHEDVCRDLVVLPLGTTVSPSSSDSGSGFRLVFIGSFEWSVPEIITAARPAQPIERIPRTREFLASFAQHCLPPMIGAAARRHGQRVGKSQVFHQLPKDLLAWGDYMEEKVAELDSLKREHPDIQVPTLATPDSLGVMVMHVLAESERRLYQLPSGCAALLRGQPVTQEILEKFVLRVVWNEAKERVVADERISKLRKARRLILDSIHDWERVFQTPRLTVRPFTLRSPDGLYPLLLCALRNAYEHALLAAVHPDHEIPAEVEVSMVGGDSGEVVQIRNTGIPEPEPASMCRRGLERDAHVFRDLTMGWHLRGGRDGNCTSYDAVRERWLTEVVHDYATLQNNGADWRR